MKASVVLPVHNKAPWLQEALDGILAQSMADFELIAVDDASTDGSAEILKACSDPRLRVISLPHNVGPGAAAQHGADEATGEYVLRADADDVQLPGRFARQVDFLDADQSVAICGADMVTMDNGQRMACPGNDAECRIELLFGVNVLQPTMAFRRAELSRARVRYATDWPRYAEDWMFLSLAAARGLRFANIPEAMVNYRRGPQGISHGRDRAVELRPVIAHAFEQYGWRPPGPEEMDLHMICLKLFTGACDASTVRRFRGWLDDLLARNDAAGTFDREAFRARVERAWDELLYFLPAHGPGPVRAYLSAGGRLGPSRAYYVLRGLLTRQRPRA